MTSTRRFFAWAGLAAYLSTTLFGELLHQAQCAPEARQSIATSDCQSHCCHHSLAGPTSDPPGDEDTDSTHDPELCSVCQTLATAVNRLTLLVSLTGGDCPPEILKSVAESAECERRFAVQARGPPC